MKNKITIDYLTQLELLLDFDNIAWWLIDFIHDSDSFYCNDVMTNFFELDSSLEKHSIAKNCPITGDYNIHISQGDTLIAKKAFDEFQSLIDRKTDYYSNKFPYQKNATKYWFQSRAKVLQTNEKNEIEYLYGIIEDVTLLEEQKAKLLKQKNTFKTLSEQDSLTSLYNQKSFLSKVLEKQSQYSSLAIVMIDIDFFKLYNDFFGHVEGDNCLIKVAAILKNLSTKYNALSARYGGEEFILAFFNTDKSTSIMILQELQHKLIDQNILHPKSSISAYLTLSIGVVISSFVKDIKLQEMIKKADKELYYVKHNGRNNISIIEHNLNLKNGTIYL